MNINRAIKVLYIEDDESVRDSASKFLNVIFENVYIAQDGDNALEMIKDIPHVDVLLTDINMPGINGIDTAVEVKKVFPDIKVIFLTAYQNDELNQTINSKIKADLVLSKPIRLNKIIEQINDVYGENK